MSRPQPRLRRTPQHLSLLVAIAVVLTALCGVVAFLSLRNDSPSVATESDATESDADRTVPSPPPTRVIAATDPSATTGARPDPPDTNADATATTAVEPPPATTERATAKPPPASAPTTTATTTPTTEKPTTIARPTTTSKPTTTTTTVPARPRASGAPRVLIYSEVGMRKRGGPGYRHESTPTAIATLTELAGALGMEVTVAADVDHNGAVTSADPSTAPFASCEALDRFDVIVVVNTGGDNILNGTERDAMRCWATNPDREPGFLGIHGAAESLGDWQWYGDLVGAFFNGHARSQDATLLLSPEASGHPTASGLPASSLRTFEEWYVFRPDNGDEPIEATPWNPRRRGTITPLLDVDESSYEPRDYGQAGLEPDRLFYGQPLPGRPDTSGKNHPVAWFQNFTADARFGNARSFYTALGHGGAKPKDPSAPWPGYTDPFMRSHLSQALAWTAGITG